jgi:hypothetical protein
MNSVAFFSVVALTSNVGRHSLFIYLFIFPDSLNLLNFLLTEEMLYKTEVTSCKLINFYNGNLKKLEDFLD